MIDRLSIRDTATRRWLASIVIALSPFRQDSAVPKMVEDYRAIVAEYTAGDPARAVAALRAWSPRETDQVKRQARWNPMTLRAAAMLETDAAFDAHTTFKDMVARLGHAAGWLTLAEQSASRGDAGTFRRRWHVAVARRLISGALVVVADRLLDDAVKSYPRDVDVLFARGLAKESLVLTYVADPTAPESTLGFMRRRRAAALQDARAAFEAVVRRAPSAIEARLRLAHVYVAQGAGSRAIPLLEGIRASSPPPPPVLGYLASLMLGDIHARSGQLSRAMPLFVEARRQLPGAQNAYLAQALALRTAGQIVAAAAVLQEMLARPKHETDPWKQYPLGLDPVDALLDPLRSEIRLR